jgi:predicted secreted protein
MKKILITVLYIVTSSIYADNISIKTPKIAENGAVVPITVIANSPINPGDMLIISGNNKVALKLTTNSNPITEVSARLRLYRSGSVSASIIRGDGSTDKVEKIVQITIGNSAKQSSNGSKKYRKKVKAGKIKILFSNIMATDKYVKEVSLSTNQGDVKIQMTPIMSQSPYISIKGKYKFKTASVSVSLNRGAKYTENEGMPERILNSTQPSANNCSKEEVLKMINNGYYKNEIDDICDNK